MEKKKDFYKYKTHFMFYTKTILNVLDLMSSLYYIYYRTTSPLLHKYYRVSTIQVQEVVSKMRQLYRAETRPQRIMSMRQGVKEEDLLETLHCIWSFSSHKVSFVLSQYQYLCRSDQFNSERKSFLFCFSHHG